MPIEQVESLRKHQRQKLHVPLKLWEVKEGQSPRFHADTACKDLSIGGLAFESKILSPMGTLFLAEVHLPGRKEPFVTHLKVMRVESLFGKQSYQIGCAFENAKLPDINFLASCLEELNLYSLLAGALKDGASDVHLTVGCPPVIRVQGKIRQMKTRVILEGQIKAMMYPLLTQEQIESLEKTKELDFAISPSQDSRFRVNLHFQKGFLEAALRSITSGVRTFAELGLPVEVLERFCREKSGLILIAGKTGAGKSTTLTSMVDHINNNIESILITVEDPIEHVHTSKKSIIKQRELGSDTQSFAEALKHSLRQDPDIVVVGEMRDRESVISAIRAAETGHLMISTVHASNAPEALERIVTLFPADEVPMVCQRLSNSLLGLLFQMLVPGRAGKLVLVTELMLSTTAIRNMLRSGAFSKMRDTIQTGAEHGMYTLEDNLRALHARGMIDSDVVQEHTRER